MLKNGRNLHTHTHTHTHGCLCKIIIPIIATFAIINPSYSDIDKNASTATCDSSTIGTTTGPANLQAQWTANTINLDFYSNDTKIGTGTCSYDGAITLPNTPTVPTGYTFGGWKVRAAAHGVNHANASQQCTLADYTLGSAGGESGEFEKYKSLNYPSGNTNDTSLNVGEWTYPFSDGLMKGIASCNTTANPAMQYFYTHALSAVSGNMSMEDFFAGFSQVATQEQVALLYELAQGLNDGTVSWGEMWARVNDGIAKDTSAQFSATATGQYCWCKATSFTPTNEESCNLGGTTYWIYHTDRESTSNCADSCAESCSNAMWDFGKNFFGLWDK